MLHLAQFRLATMRFGYTLTGLARVDHGQVAQFISVRDRAFRCIRQITTSFRNVTGLARVDQGQPIEDLCPDGSYVIPFQKLNKETFDTQVAIC